MRVELVRYEDPRPDRPLGKAILRPESPEELEELDAFRKHVGRHGGGDKFEVVFFAKKPRPEPEPATAGGGDG